VEWDQSAFLEVADALKLNVSSVLTCVQAMANVQTKEFVYAKQGTMVTIVQFWRKVRAE
jgi:hypothetical protein